VFDVSSKDLVRLGSNGNINYQRINGRQQIAWIDVTSNKINVLRACSLNEKYNRITR